MQVMNKTVEIIKDIIPVGSYVKEVEFFDNNGDDIYGVARPDLNTFMILRRSEGVVVERRADNVELEELFGVWMYNLKRFHNSDNPDDLKHHLIIKTSSENGLWGNCNATPELHIDRTIVFYMHNQDKDVTVFAADPAMLYNDCFVKYLYREYARVMTAYGIPFLTTNLMYAVNAVIEYGHDEAIFVDSDVLISYSYHDFVRSCK